jgi:hypothetical protein
LLVKKYGVIGFMLKTLYEALDTQIW